MELDVKRLNNNLATVGTWSVVEALNGQLLANMRQFATHPSSIYELNFPTVNNVNDIAIEVSNMLTTNEYQVIGMEYNGNYNIDGLFSSRGGNFMEFGPGNPLPTNDSGTHVYSAVQNMAAVIGEPLGEVYWQDKVNNRVWFKIRGGVYPGNPNYAPLADFNLYKSFQLRAFGSFAPLSNALNTYVGAVGLQVFPNPSSSEISLKRTNADNLENDILIINALGQIVYKKQPTQLTGENNLNLDVSNWSNGLYFVKVGQETVKLLKK